MLNRTEAPGFNTIDSIEIIQAKKQTLDNGIDVYSIDAGSQALTRIEFLFKAGMYYQEHPLIASSANNLAETGTKTRTADQISDSIDFYGSFFECGVDQDFAHFTLYSLNKYLDQTIVFVEDVIKNPVFPKTELDILLSNKKQKHLVNSQKVSVLARRRFNELLFGEKHPYGIDVKTENFDEVSLQQVTDFYSSHYHSKNCTIVVSGWLPPNLMELLNQHFGKSDWGNGNIVQKGDIAAAPTPQQKHFILKEDAIQSAIRVGRLLFNKTHPDYFKFQVLNTILGGYFGSRLMANIREDKGYTYGIGSGLASLVRDGYFFISTEVGTDVTKDALKEIYHEIKRLREEPIGEEELELVKNYILGQFLRSVEGPFSLADKFKAIWEFGLGYDYFDKYFKAVQNVTAAELKDMANKYLQEKDLIECVVGKM
ncbi:MAG: peptidase [Bacteroidetes bacterium]|jgi:predicted Zn-dependent peptidase|nr:peptidase [Bacteroidota bacterium]